jgi:regulatory protein
VTTITKTEKLRDGGIKVHTSAGFSFFLRPRYLEGIDVSIIEEGAELSPHAADCLLAASHIYLAERKALTYCARSEQCRFLLTQKLLKKNFTADACQSALDFLEETGDVCDARYARAWLSERAGRKPEGRRRLEAELAHRGIDAETARSALDEFFAEHSEEDALHAAYAKALRLKKDPARIPAYLTRQGFSFAQIRSVHN